MSRYIPIPGVLTPTERDAQTARNQERRKSKDPQCAYCQNSTAMFNKVLCGIGLKWPGCKSKKPGYLVISE